MGECRFGLINIIGKQPSLDLETNLYKFSNYDYFIKSITGNYLYFSKILDWPDMWEIPGNLIPNIEVDCSDLFNSVVKDDNRLFGSCFSTDYRCDAFWNRYAMNNDNDTVCFSTSVSKLLLVPDFDGYVDSGLIGRVLYKEIEYADDFISDPYDAEYVLQYLLPFIKRSSFSYEKEVRLIIESLNNDSSLLINTNMCKLINEVYISPKMDMNKKENIKELLKTKMPHVNVVEYDAYGKKTLEIRNKEEFENKIRKINNALLAANLTKYIKDDYTKLLLNTN